MSVHMHFGCTFESDQIDSISEIKSILAIFFLRNCFGTPSFFTAFSLSQATVTDTFGMFESKLRLSIATPIPNSPPNSALYEFPSSGSPGIIPPPIIYSSLFSEIMMKDADIVSWISKYEPSVTHIALPSRTSSVSTPLRSRDALPALRARSRRQTLPWCMGRPRTTCGMR